jgi:hypothetical protein
MVHGSWRGIVCACFDGSCCMDEGRKSFYIQNQITNTERKELILLLFPIFFKL